MKNVATLSIALMMLTLTSCELVGDIFGAGFYTGLFVVALVIVIIVFLVFKFRRK